MVFNNFLIFFISLELTRVNPDWNIFSINVELLFLLHRGLVHYHRRILNQIWLIGSFHSMSCEVRTQFYKLNIKFRVFVDEWGLNEKVEKDVDDWIIDQNNVKFKLTEPNVYRSVSRDCDVQCFLLHLYM